MLQPLKYYLIQRDTNKILLMLPLYFKFVYISYVKVTKNNYLQKYLPFAWYGMHISEVCLNIACLNIAFANQSSRRPKISPGKSKAKQSEIGRRLGRPQITFSRPQNTANHSFRAHVNIVSLLTYLLTYSWKSTFSALFNVVF